jgi:hypothetical protein
MELLDNWTEVLKKAWSVKFGAGAAFFAVLEFLSNFTDTLWLIKDIIPQNTFMTLAMVCSIASLVSRFLKQKGVLSDADASTTQDS